MENLKITTMKNLSIKIIFLGTLLFMTSCDKNFGDLNKNPFNPTETSIGPLFNKVVHFVQTNPVGCPYQRGLVEPEHRH